MWIDAKIELPTTEETVEVFCDWDGSLDDKLLLMSYENGKWWRSGSSTNSDYEPQKGILFWRKIIYPELTNKN